MDDDDDTTHVENYAMSEMRRQSERYAMNDDPTAHAMAAIEQAIRTRPTLPMIKPPLNDTLIARNVVHGDFTDDADMAQRLKNLMRTGKNWTRLKPCQAEALEQIQTKVARILAGDPDYPDHWRDLQGYPRLVEERL